MTYLTWSEDLAVGNNLIDGDDRNLSEDASRSTQGARMKKRILVAAVLLATTGWLHAQTIVPSLDQPGRKGDMARLVQQKAKEKFDAADRDKDGKLSKEEASAAFPFMSEHFSRYDKNGDGFLTWEEYVGHDRWKKD